MKIVAGLILSSMIMVIKGQPQSCSEIGPPDVCLQYAAGKGQDFCCKVLEQDNICVADDCPADPPPEPTVPEDICYCPTSMPTIATTPSPTTKSYAKKTKKTKGSGSGIGYGDCDCDKDYGVAELRFIYQGSEPSVTIILKNKDKDFTYCTFDDVKPNGEVVCNIAEAIANGYGNEDFENETYFTIINNADDSYICDGSESFHTSCSSDIVGLAMCNNNIICSGWKDGNPNDNNDCDDGQEECSCDDDTETNPEDTPSPVDPDTIGDVCYCKVDNCTPSPIMVSASSKSKSKSKKGKSKSKSKSSSKDSGMGCGDCDCDKDYGMVEIRVLYTGSDDITIEWKDKGGDDQICLDSDVSQGEEATCNVNDFTDNNGDPVYEKLETNTFAKLIDNNGDEICTTEIHTSCSRDIVGTEGEGNCAAGLIIVTGWKDGNPNDDNDCDDGYYQCDCELDEGQINPDAVGPAGIAGNLQDGGYSAYVVANSNSDGELVTSNANQINAKLLSFIICALVVIKLF